MRKLLSISLSMLLMVSTIGITVHNHYCENDLIASSIFPHGAEDDCDTEMPSKDNRACSDEHQQYNVDSPIVLFSINFEIAPSVDWVVTSYYSVIFDKSEKKFTPKLFADVNPPPSEPNIYTKVQSFLL